MNDTNIMLNVANSLQSFGNSLHFWNSHWNFRGFAKWVEIVLAKFHENRLRIERKDRFRFWLHCRMNCGLSRNNARVDEQVQCLTSSRFLCFNYLLYGPSQKKHSSLYKELSKSVKMLRTVPCPIYKNEPGSLGNVSSIPRRSVQSQITVSHHM